MAMQRLTSEDRRLRDLERHLLMLSDLPASDDIPDPELRRYVDTLPPNIAAQLVAKVQQMRKALSGAMAALEHVGYPQEAYAELSPEERASPQWRADIMPYGGLKDSGMGKEGPGYAIEEMSELKMVVFHLQS